MSDFFKKIAVLLILKFLFTSSISLAEIVKKIEVGNERISDETIKMFSKTSIGDDVSENDLNDILKDVYESSFEDVKVSINNNILNIRVIENPLVENVEIKGPKAKKIKELIKKNLKIKARSSYNESFFKSDKKKIINELKEIGYFFSKVDVVIEELKDNKINLIYQIEMGEKAKIKKISFIGDKIYKDRKLRSVIVSEEYKFWKFISEKIS